MTDTKNNAHPVTAAAEIAVDVVGREHEHPADFGTTLEREARAFSARAKDGETVLPPSRRFVVVDLEFAWDHDRYAGYRISEGEGAEQNVRWPFHRVAAACWMVMRFDPLGDVPEVEELAVITSAEADEVEIVQKLFSALDRNEDATLLSWGGEAKDFAVLRLCAAENELVLPVQLRCLSPQAPTRIDLCRAVAVQARPVHLPEYAAATSIPSKPSPSKSIGALVEAGAWKDVREQVLADVLTTAVIGLRHLVSHAIVAFNTPRSIAALAEAAVRAMPSSKFLQNSFCPWARAQLAASRLRGPVFRAA